MSRVGEAGARATILDVARRAGVSRQTVSRALNGQGEVSDATRAAVLAAAAELRYRPNVAARGLKGGQGVAIGLVVDDLTNPYYPEVASALARLAAARGWSVVLCDVAPLDAAGVDDGESAVAAIATVARQTDVLVGYFPGATRRWLDGNQGSPVVLLDAEPRPGAATIVVDYEAGLRDVVRHLADSGRRRIAIVDAAGRPTARRAAITAAVAGAGLPALDVLAVSAPSTTIEGGAVAARQLAARGEPFDAIVAFNDILAVGALSGLADAGRVVPDDCAVVGVDGLELGAFVSPPLTTLRIDRSDLAARAIELAATLLGADAGGEHPKDVIVPELVIRASSAPGVRGVAG